MRTYAKRKAAAVFLSALLCLAALFLASACAESASEETKTEQAYIVSIQEAEGGGYTVVYSDGSTSSLAVESGEDGKDGKDGEDGEDLTIEAIWQAYIAETGEDLTLAEFIGQYLNLTEDRSASVAQSLRSCVSVYTEFVETQSIGSGGFFPGGGMGGMGGISELVQGAGSGVIYKMDDDSVYIVTNYHVVYDGSADEDKNGGSKIARAIYCYLYGSEATPVATGYDEDGYYQYEYGEQAIACEYIGGSLEADIAVLRAEKEAVFAVNDGVRAVTLANGYHVGESVYAIGNAEGEGITATEGIVSVDSEYISLDVDDDGTEESYRSLRFDATIYHGNSGGGLFNAQGELIGITNAGVEGYEAICYAIPVSVARGTADNILYHYGDEDEETNGVYKVTLGVTVAGENARYVLEEDGYGKIEEQISVQSVTEGSLAETLGIAAQDVLTAFIVNGREYALSRTFDIGDLILTLRPEDTLQISYERGGEAEVTAEYTLTADLFAAA